MVRKIGHISISDTPCHAPMRLMNIITRIKSGGPHVHTCPVLSDLRGVDAGSGVSSGSGQHVQGQEMAILPGNKFLGQRVNMPSSLPSLHTVMPTPCLNTFGIANPTSFYIFEISYMAVSGHVSNGLG